MSDDRETLTVREPRITSAGRFEQDLEKLWPQPEFKRWLFTILKNAFIYDGIYGTDVRHFVYGEGRRSLGYDILRQIENIDPNAHALILTEVKSQMEAPNASRRSRRTDELDDGHGRRSEPGERQAQWLDYDA